MQIRHLPNNQWYWSIYCNVRINDVHVIRLKAYTCTHTVVFNSTSISILYKLSRDISIKRNQTRGRPTMNSKWLLLSTELTKLIPVSPATRYWYTQQLIKNFKDNNSLVFRMQSHHKGQNFSLWTWSLHSMKFNKLTHHVDSKKCYWTSKSGQF
jgi:hypothetical protein